jgi:hypothetical protein
MFAWVIRRCPWTGMRKTTPNRSGYARLRHPHTGPCTGHPRQIRRAPSERRGIVKCSRPDLEQDLIIVTSGAFRRQNRRIRWVRWWPTCFPRSGGSPLRTRRGGATTKGMESRGLRELISFIATAMSNGTRPLKSPAGLNKAGCIPMETSGRIIIGLKNHSFISCLLEKKSNES